MSCGILSGEGYGKHGCFFTLCDVFVWIWDVWGVIKALGRVSVWGLEDELQKQIGRAHV